MSEPDHTADSAEAAEASEAAGAASASEAAGAAAAEATAAEAAVVDTTAAEATGADATAAFAERRDLLFGVAYRILGRTTEAEDVVQDTWLRWRDVRHSEVENTTGYLVRTAARLAVDRLRQASNRHESYVGPWLPEPILTGPDVAEEVERADTVSLGLLVVLETLSPLERAVFVLREAFGFSHAEIAAALDRGEPAVRQLARRARAHVRARRPRFDTDRATHRELTERFLAACAGGDLDALLATLAPDVTLTGDGGGVQKAPLRVIAGSDRVGRFLLGITSQQPPEPEAYLADINGFPGLVVTSRGAPFAAVAFDVVDGRITSVWLLANPEKLTALRDATPGS